MGSHEDDADIWQESLNLFWDFHAADSRHLNIQKDQVIEYAVISDIVKQIPALGISGNFIADTLRLQAVFDNSFMLINSLFSSSHIAILIKATLCSFQRRFPG